MRDTPLLIEGVSPDDISVGFLVDVMDIAKDHGYRIDGLSILREGRGELLVVERRP